MIGLESKVCKGVANDKQVTMKTFRDGSDLLHAEELLGVPRCSLYGNLKCGFDETIRMNGWQPTFSKFE
jgi:hypothetical protein